MYNKKREQAKHEAQMHRLLTEILDDKNLALNIFFKGGTCARMLGFLDRFSVDLDFDLKEGADKKELKKSLYGIFKKLNLEIKDESKNALQFFLKYSAPKDERNTIKLEILDKTFTSNKYSSQYLLPINRTAICQTIETMFAHKLIALIDRFEQGGGIAGRDVYDIHYFFSQGYDYSSDVIEERRGIPVKQFFKELKEFIDKEVNSSVIDQDLNVLLDYDKFKVIRKHLKQETVNFINSEINYLH